MEIKMEMTHFGGIFLLLIFLACSKSTTYSMPERGVCAHRGACITHPENTISAFQEAIRLGAHMIEFDVRLSKDEKLVIMHDSAVDRTTSGSGEIVDLTLAEIKTLDAGSAKGAEFKGEKVPTFSEVLEIMPENIWLNIHIYGGPLAGEKIARMVQQQNRLHQAVLACDNETAAAARAIVPEIQICNMEGQKFLDSYVRDTIKNEDAFIQLLRSSPDQTVAVVPELNAKNIRINYCCTDDPDEIKALFEAGVEFPLVNDVAAMLEVAKALGLEPLVPKFRNK